MALRYANRKLAAEDGYKPQANPDCRNCGGRGSYYYADAYMPSGVAVICDCIPDPWKRVRDFTQDILPFIVYGVLGVLFWGWTAVLWWRWIRG